MNVIERSRQSRSNLKPAALAILCLGVVVAQIDTSVVNLAVQPIGLDLGASVTQLQWVIDAYNLVYAALLMATGPLTAVAVVTVTAPIAPARRAP
ncbi:major facilitator superfamily domain-containing protein (plasmid) [Rhizobium sp. CIAT894]|uniref:hypothetical protein n=1 Tax=Rhizobium sp. CIAT894 TaxID=2020312 RepID=UPI000A200385|nr:hypothetical protein [Rhizobium sp. CIAT894]ARM92406.1 major facilitator superfamily domain-containing protein [Rhizobium sp. CIAT894]